MGRPAPPPFTLDERAVLTALQARAAEHPDPDVAMFMTARERNLLMRCAEFLIWKADSDPAWGDKVEREIRDAGLV